MDRLNISPSNSLISMDRFQPQGEILRLPRFQEILLTEGKRKERVDRKGRQEILQENDHGFELNNDG